MSRITWLTMHLVTQHVLVPGHAWLGQHAMENKPAEAAAAARGWRISGSLWEVQKRNPKGLKNGTGHVQDHAQAKQDQVHSHPV